MKMAKASERDIEVALKLTRAIEDLISGWLPAGMTGDDAESLKWFDEADAPRVIEHLVEIAKQASIFRVVFGMSVVLDPRNEVVDPNDDTLALHPKHTKAAEQRDELLAALKALVHRLDLDTIDLHEWLDPVRLGYKTPHGQDNGNGFTAFYAPLIDAAKAAIAKAEAA